ncbi:reverse transcriptase domain-containing protein [Tanacetum coccineum]
MNQGGVHDRFHLRHRAEVSVANLQLKNSAGPTVPFIPPHSNTGMEAMLKSGLWLIRNVPLILRKWTPMENVYKEDIKTNVELKDTIVVAVPKIDGDEYVLHSIRVEYEWKPTRCRVCMVFGHDDMTCPKRVVDEPKKKSGNNNDVYQPISIKNGASTSETKKNAETTRLEATTSKPIKSSKDKEINESNVASTSSNTEDLQNRDGVDSNTRIKKVDDLVNEESESDVDEVFNVTVSFRTSKLPKINKGYTSGTRVRNSSLYEQWKENYEEDPYDDDNFDDLGLTEEQLDFANAFDINLRG